MVKNPPAMQEMQVQSLGGEYPQRRQWQATPAFLPGKSHGQRSLVGYSPQGRKESDMTEHAQMHAFPEIKIVIRIFKNKVITLWSSFRRLGTRGPFMERSCDKREHRSKVEIPRADVHLTNNRHRVINCWIKRNHTPDCFLLTKTAFYLFIGRSSSRRKVMSFTSPSL